MSTRIGLISDVHATPAPLREALLLFKQAGVEQIFCLGDIAGYGSELEPTVALLCDFDCHAILGNHDQWYLEDHSADVEHPAMIFFNQLPTVRQVTIAGVTIYMVHASPPDSCMEGIRLLDQDGELIPEQVSGWAERLRGFQHDVLIVGHTHQVFAEPLANTLVVNPGSTAFNHTCALLSLPERTVEWLPLSNKTPQRVWNWSGGLPD